MPARPPVTRELLDASDSEAAQWEPLLPGESPEDRAARLAGGPERSRAELEAYRAAAPVAGALSAGAAAELALERERVVGLRQRVRELEQLLSARSAQDEPW
jgi:hypothetical protein